MYMYMYISLVKRNSSLVHESLVFNMVDIDCLFQWFIMAIFHVFLQHTCIGMTRCEIKKIKLHSIRRTLFVFETSNVAKTIQFYLLVFSCSRCNTRHWYTNKWTKSLAESVCSNIWDEGRGLCLVICFDL